MVALGGWDFFPHPHELLIWAYPENLVKTGQLEDELWWYLRNGHGTAWDSTVWLYRKIRPKVRGLKGLISNWEALFTSKSYRSNFCTGHLIFLCIIRVVQYVAFAGDNVGKCFIPFLMTYTHGPEIFIPKFHDLGSPQAPYIFSGALVRSKSPKSKVCHVGYQTWCKSPTQAYLKIES